jgi:CubicO group peptidase (beta-lactamase class C family)
LGSRCIYSDLEFLTLGLLVERVSGLRLDEFCRREFYEPLGLVDTGYRPPPEKWARCAATEECAWRGRVMRGEVHDENAYACGGVAGHAGLFGTAPELARLLGSILAAHPAHRLPIADCRLPIADCQSLESGVRKSQIANRKSQDSGKSQIANRKSQIGHGVRSLLRSDTVAAMLTRQPGPAHDRFALGWKWLNYADGEVSASEDAFGHDGFTGTLLWADPRRDLAVVFLSNRVHPSRDNRRIYEVRPAFVRSVIRAAD